MHDEKRLLSPRPSLVLCCEIAAEDVGTDWGQRGVSGLDPLPTRLI